MYIIKYECIHPNFLLPILAMLCLYINYSHLDNRNMHRKIGQIRLACGHVSEGLT